MARPLRIEFAGALYHVTSRGDGQDDIYLDDQARRCFLEVLSGVCEQIYDLPVITTDVPVRFWPERDSDKSN